MDQANITAIEQRYQSLQQALASGRISQSDFISATADLYFQDTAGRFWALGTQTGGWYYHDGHDWQPADPRSTALLPRIATPGQSVTEYPKARPELPSEPGHASPNPNTQSQAGERRPSRTAFSPWTTIPTRSLLVVGFAFVLFLAALALPAGGAPPLSGPAAAPSPRPPIGAASGGGGSGGSDGDGQTQGAIVGTVTDLSTGQPGEGIEVSVSGFPPVRSDSQGHYSVTGLPAAEYTVSLQLHEQETPAQGPIFVVLDGASTTTVDLAYHSQGLAATLVTQPVSATNPPPDLPQSGAPISRGPLIAITAGLLILSIGWSLRQTMSGSKPK
jgi:hypothetical protein